MNRVTLIGRLGKDPEVRFTPNGKAVGNFTIATSEKWTGKDGEKQEKTEWHRIVVWDKQAELCAEYLSKGRQVAIEGKLQTREWTNKEGVKQYTTEVVANHVEFLGSKEDGKPTSRGKQGAADDSESPAEPEQPQDGESADDQIPF